MSNESNNNDEEERQTKITINLKDKENLKNTFNLNSTSRGTKKKISPLEISKKVSNLEDTDRSSTEKMNRELKKNVTKRLKSSKKKKRKKKNDVEPVLLTEVKQNLLPKKVEEEKKESNAHKFLREKLEKLNFSKNLQIGIHSGFEKINEAIKDNIENNNFYIKDKKINLDNIINKNNKKSLEINTGKGGIIYNINKESILRLKHLKQNEKNIRKKLDKIEESQKMIESEAPMKNDCVNINVRNNNLKKINSMKNELLVKLRYNSSIISEVIDKEKNINRNLLIQNYNNHTNKTEIGASTKHFSLSEDQEKFNKYLMKKQEEEKLQREKIQNELKKSNSKKSKQIELNEHKILERQKEHLNELKKKEKDFLNKLKEKNNLLFEKSIKNIDKNIKRQTKDYFFFQVKQKYESNEKKLLDKVNMIKKDSLVTKLELEELANKRNERKKILEEGLTERRLNLIKMWQHRSQKLPIYRHPVVDVLEDEQLDIMEDEQEKIEQKEKNEQTKKNYQPPKVKINLQLKKIREKKINVSKKDSVTQTEINNKKRFMKNLDFMANIIEAAKEETLEKNKSKNNQTIKTERNTNSKDRLKLAKSLDSNDNKKKHIYQLHPKPEKPIDYLKEIFKGKKGNIREKKEQGVDNIIADLNDDNNTIKGRNQILDTLDMIKSKTDAIEQKVIEKKDIMKIKGGYINNTNIGDEVGNLLIESIQTKISLLNKLKGK